LDDTITADEYTLWEVGKVGMIRYDPQDPRRSVWVGTGAAA